ncbi:5331_t:CDS:2, partial [Ambispora leptoticha]
FFEEEYWCMHMHFNEINDNVKKITRNHEIDKFIWKAQQRNKDLKWINLREFFDTKCSAKGGFEAVFSGKWKNDLIIQALPTDIFNVNFPIQNTMIALKSLENSKICSICNEKGFIGYQCLKDGCKNLKRNVDFSCLLCISTNIRLKTILCKTCNPTGIGLCVECFGDEFFEEEYWCMHMHFNEINDDVKKITRNHEIDKFIWKEKQRNKDLKWINLREFFEDYIKHPIINTKFALKDLENSKICSICNAKGFIGYQCLKDGCKNLKRNVDFSCLSCISTNIRLKSILCKTCNPTGIGLCLECYGGEEKYWCIHLDFKGINEDLEKRTGNYEMDKFIWETNQKVKDLEWIDFNDFFDIKYLAKGGFATVYSANWRSGRDSQVALKCLENSKNFSKEFLNELYAYYECIGKSEKGITCYGISFYPEKNQLVLVLKYAEKGNIRQYLQNERQNLNWYRRVQLLEGIIENLKLIHSKNYIHRDIHSGNVLKGRLVLQSYITDLGLSRPVEEDDIDENERDRSRLNHDSLRQEIYPGVDASISHYVSTVHSCDTLRTEVHPGAIYTSRFISYAITDQSNASFVSGSNRI